MRSILFTQMAIDEMNRFKSGQQQLAFKILELITDIQKNPFSGLGKPEALKGNLKGYWSRRINDEHRLLYKVTNEIIEIYKCYGHYDDLRNNPTSKSNNLIPIKGTITPPTP